MFARILENIKMAFFAIWANKVRSFLTMLGIIIGVFAVVELLAVGEGVKSEVSKEIESLGSNILVVVPGKLDMQSGQINPAATLGASSLTQDDIADVKQRVSAIDAIAPMMLISSPIQYGDKTNSSSLVVGTTPDMFRVRDVALSSGRVLEKSDEERKARNAFIGYNLSAELFGDEDPIGKQVTIRGEQIRVVGVQKKPKESALSFGGPDFNNIVYLPFSTGEELTKSSQIFRIVMKISSQADIDQAKEDVKRAILQSHKNSEDFTVFSQEDLVDLIGTVLDVMRALLGALGAISLLVGGIGIMNIMLVSVTERTREIGVRKALGASQFDILLQFLTESLVLSFLGGAIAIAISFGVAAAVSANAGFGPVITSEFIFLALGFSILIGIIFGVAPAIRAARLDPIKALKYE